MGIRRTRLAFEEDYTRIKNDWVRDKRISRKARGLLAELLSHRVGWVITLDSLVEGGPEGRDAIRSAISELVLTGYLIRRRERGEDGKLGGSEYELQEPPESGEPTSGNPTQAGRPLKKTISSEDHLSEHQRVKTRRSATRRPSNAQMTMLRDLVLLLDYSDDPDVYLEGEELQTVQDADDLIKEYWVGIEHAGRDYIAEDVLRDPSRYSQLSEKGRAFVDNEDLTEAFG